MSRGIFLGMQALSNKAFNPSPDVELIKGNQKLSTSLGEATNRLQQEVGKSALATDDLVNAVETRDVTTSIVEEAKARRPVNTISPVKTTPPATATDPAPFSEMTGSSTSSVPDFADKVVDGKVNTNKYGELLEEAALKLHLEQTVERNVPSNEEGQSVDLSILQERVRQLEPDTLGPSQETASRRSGWRHMPPLPTKRPTPTPK